MLSNPQAGSDDRSGAGRPTGEASSQPRLARAWLGRLSTCIASFAGGMAINDVDGPLGYHGLAGAVALSGVVTATVWMRGLHPRAGLARYGPPLLLVPAGCTALVAAFSSGPTVSILTAWAAVLTVSAVLVTNELEYAALLLIGASFIALGVASIAFGVGSVTHHGVLDGAQNIFVGAGLIMYGAGATIVGPGVDVDGEGAVWMSIALGIGIIALGGGVIRNGGVLPGVTLIVSGAALIALVAWIVASRSEPPEGVFTVAGAGTIALGAGIIAYGAATIGLSVILIHARPVVEWATKPPRAVEDQQKEPSVDENQA